MKQTSSTSTPRGPAQAPDFKQVRKHLRTIHQREALGRFIKARWTPAELGEFARAVFLAPGKSYPTAASYQYALEKGPDHPYAVETLASLRAPGFLMPPFSRPEPKEFAWDDPESPEHTHELRAEIEEMGRLWQIREATFSGQPCPEAFQPISNALWRRLFRLRNHYHSLAHASLCERLSEEIQADVVTIARCRRNRGACVNNVERPDLDMPIPQAIWEKCFSIRARYSSLEDALEHQGLAQYR
jgi:hypothetical protein